MYKIWIMSSEISQLKISTWNSRKFSKLLHFEVFLSFQYNCRANVCICFVGIFNFSTRNSIQSKGWRWWYRCCLKRVKHTNWLLRSGVKMKFLRLRKFEGLPFLISNQIQNQISKSYRLKNSKIICKGPESARSNTVPSGGCPIWSVQLSIWLQPWLMKNIVKLVYIK